MRLHCTGGAGDVKAICPHLTQIPRRVLWACHLPTLLDMFDSDEEPNRLPPDDPRDDNRYAPESMMVAPYALRLALSTSELLVYQLVFACTSASGRALQCKLSEMAAFLRITEASCSRALRSLCRSQLLVSDRVGREVAVAMNVNMDSWIVDLREQPEPRLSREYDYIPQETRFAVYRRDSYRCLHCNAETRLSIDHIVPVSRGGTHDIDNMQTLCRSCNSRKRDTLVSEVTIDAHGESAG